MKFTIIIEKDETGYTTAEVPALPGCVSQGKTPEEARENIREAVEGWIEVMNDKAKKSGAIYYDIAV
jgi:predicted RNase H-like HicB family nuclease